MTTIGLAVLAGVGVLLSGNLPWGALFAPLNLRVFPVAPWAIVPMAAYLWIYWRFISGAIGSPQTALRRLPTEMPAITAFLLLVMAAVVAGVTEEAGFRGYMLEPIERRYGLLPAILVTGCGPGSDLRLPPRRSPGRCRSRQDYISSKTGTMEGSSSITSSDQHPIEKVSR
jgi:membrane protease YdiL (CAAX protease family)